MPNTLEVDFSHLQARAADQSRLFLVSILDRIGVQGFSTELEWTHFSPRGSPNDLFDIDLVKWPDPDMVFIVISIPADYRPQAEALAEKWSLRIANGVPLVLTVGRQEWFPIQGPNVWTLENRTGWKGYGAGREVLETLRSEERSWLQAFFAERGLG
jgi:hypothetical protein